MILLFVLVTLAACIFYFNNTAEVGLWLGRDFAARPVGIWVIAAFICGGLTGLLCGFGLWRKVRLRLQILHLKSQLEQSNKDAAQLRQKLKTLQKHQDS